MLDFKYIWNGEPFIYFFNAIKEWLHPNVHIILYSCFNYSANQIVSDIKNLSPDNRKNKIKVYYSGERFFDDKDSDITISFLPNNYTFKELNLKSSNLIKNLNYQYDKPIENITIKILQINISDYYNYNFNELVKYETNNKNKIYIQLRDQERVEIEYLLREQLKIEKLNLYSSIKFNQQYLENLAIYQNVNYEWNQMYQYFIKEPYKINQKKQYFCCFIVSNPNCVQRNMFFELLKKYKPIQSCGQYMKNVSFVVPDRILEQDDYLKFISKFKFMITFENYSTEYYHTEKIFNAMRAGTVPIYWGDPLVEKLYNKNCFINIPSRDSNTNQQYTLVEQYKEFEKIVEKVINYDTNQKEYVNLFKEPCILNAKQEDIKIKNNIKVIENLIYLEK